MAGMAYAADEILFPQGIIFDCRELRYDWGDTMTTLFAKFLSEPDKRLAEILGVRPRATVFVVSDLCRAGLTSLCTAEMRIDPVTVLFDSIDEAAAENCRRFEQTLAVQTD